MGRRNGGLASRHFSGLPTKVSMSRTVLYDQRLDANQISPMHQSSICLLAVAIYKKHLSFPPNRLPRQTESLSRPLNVSFPRFAYSYLSLGSEANMMEQYPSPKRRALPETADTVNAKPIVPSSSFPPSMSPQICELVKQIRTPNWNEGFPTQPLIG